MGFNSYLYVAKEGRKILDNHEGLPGGVLTGMIDMLNGPEIYDKKDILAWYKIPE